jgi:hypothetical protein
MPDGGTTALQVARHLAPELRATVVTHSPAVAAELGRRLRIEVDLIDGRLFKHSLVLARAVAAEAIGRIRADIFFMGVTGIHPKLGLTTGGAEEAVIKRALNRQSAETLVLASREKLGAASPFRVLTLEEVDGVIVEADPVAEMLQPYLGLGLSITRAPDAGPGPDCDDAARRSAGRQASRSASTPLDDAMGWVTPEPGRPAAVHRGRGRHVSAQGGRFQNDA